MAQSRTWASMTDNLIMTNSVTSHPSSNAQGGWTGRTKWTYVMLSNGDTVIDPVMGFYRNPPVGAQCSWSTDHGRKAPAFFERDDWAMPLRELTRWSDEKLASVAEEYSQKYWEDMRHLVRPETFEELYRYFDSATLWLNGAYNMWNLLNMLVTEAHHRWPAVLADWKNCIDAFVNDYINARVGHLHNRVVLRQWDGVGDMLIQARGFHDWPYDEINTTLDLQQQDMIREALISHHMSLSGRECSTPQYYPWYPRPDVNMLPDAVNAPTQTAPDDVVAANSVAVVAHQSTAALSTNIASVQLSEPGVAASATPAMPDRSVMPPSSPPSAPLTSIPEEPVVVKTDPTVIDIASRAKANETAADSGIATTRACISVPNIVANDATSPCDNKLRGHHDSIVFTDILPINPGPSSSHLQVQGRHLSTSSAPEEASEPMLDGADAGVQKRIASEAPPTMKSTSFSKPAQQNPKATSGPGNYQANKKGRQGPACGPRKPTRTNGPIQHRNLENAPLYRFLQQFQQQPSPHTGPSAPHPPQQMMPTFRPLNGMALPPALFISSQPGMQPGPNSDVHHIPAPLPNMPFMRTSMMPFQDQIPIPPPHIGQMPFRCRNGPPMSPMNTPLPPLTGPQHQRSSVYPANGQIPQSEHLTNCGLNVIRDGSQLSHKQGPGKRDNRRNSINSNTIRKVRDDPIHGAVYSLGQPRKISNASSGQRPSIVNGSHRPTGAFMPPCKNYPGPHPASQIMPSVKLKFHECLCVRCEEATRSVYVRARGEVDPSDPEGNLLKHFAKFNPVAVKPKKSGYLVVFQNDLSAIYAIQEACTSSDKSIKDWTTEASVWYPFCSKHYTGDFKGNAAGLPRHLYETRSRATSFETSSRRDSDTFRGTQRPAMYFDDTSVTSGGSGPEQHGFQPAHPPSHGSISFNPGDAMKLQPMPPAHPHRQLWVPPASPQRPSTAPSSFVQSELPIVIMNCPGLPAQRREDILQEEGWRSKPPSEEALTTNGANIPVDDTASNHSLQGAKSIQVSLPSEGGAAHEAVLRTPSRGASPEVDSKPQEMIQKQTSDKAKTGEPETCQDSPKDRIAKPEPCNTTVACVPEVAKDNYEKNALMSRAITPETVKPVETHKKKKAPRAGQDTHRKLDEKVTSKRAEENSPDIAPKVKVSGYRKITTEVAAPIESLELSSTKGSYRKTTDQLSSAVERIGYAVGTVIRHKPSRSPLPTEWVPDEPRSQTCPSMEEPIGLPGIRGRFGEIGTVLGLEELQSQSHQLFESRASDAAESPLQAQRGPQTHEPMKKSTKTKGKAQVGSSRSASRSNPPTETQPYGSYLALNHLPSTAAEAASYSSGPSPATEKSNSTNGINQSVQAVGMKKKKCKSKGKRKPTQTALELSSGLTKSSGCQNNKHQDTRQGSPSKKLMTSQTELAEENYQPEATELVFEPQNKIDEQHSEQENSRYRANNGGSLRMDKNRAPAKSDTTILCTIFEPPTKDAKDVSPDSNLFPRQKFSIDQARKAGPPPKMSLDANVQKVRTTEDIGNNNKGLHICSETKSISKQPSGDWASVVKGSLHSGKNDDPFSSSKREETPKEWIKKSAQKGTSQIDNEKALRNQTPPTPSPEKKSQRSTNSKSKLNATAQSFALPRTSSPASNLRLDPKAKEFTRPHSSSPAMSVASSAGHKYGGPAYLKGNEPPQLAARSALPKQTALNDGQSKKPKQGHAKKPSIPGQPTGIDKRFVTPAEQILDPSKVSQPSPPAKDKKNGGGGPRQGPISDRTGGKSKHIPTTSTPLIPSSIAAAEQSKQAPKSEVAAKTTTGTVLSKADDGYPSLSRAAAARPAQKSAPSIAKIVTPIATTIVPSSAPVSDKATTTTTQNGEAKQNQTQSQRSIAAAAPAFTKTQQSNDEKKKPDDLQPSDENMWQTVGSTKKVTGGGAAKSHGGRGGHGGHARSTEEQKGG